MARQRGENLGGQPSVVEIAQRAAVNPGLISYYFGGKEKLVRPIFAAH